MTAEAAVDQIPLPPAYMLGSGEYTPSPPQAAMPIVAPMGTLFAGAPTPPRQRQKQQQRRAAEAVAKKRAVPAASEVLTAACALESSFLTTQHKSGVTSVAMKRARVPHADLMRQLDAIKDATMAWIEENNLRAAISEQLDSDVCDGVERVLNSRGVISKENNTEAIVDIEPGCEKSVYDFMRKSTLPMSCTRCRRGKKSCTHGLPCSRCVQAGEKECVYIVASPKAGHRAPRSH